MERKTRKVGVWALIAGLIVLSVSTSACTSASPAPISYGHAPAPVFAPSPVAPSLDFSTPPYDEFTAPRVVYDQPASECVPFARTISGVAIWGDAVTWWKQAAGKYPRSSRPAEGSVLVLRGWQDDKRGHVAVVKAMLGPRVIRVDHANWLHGGEVSLDVPVIDVSPANDWSQVRVWHVPGMHWGGRTYASQGFIHPIGVSAPTASAPQRAG